MSKSKLLFLSHILPYPPDSGAAIRTSNTLRILGGVFDVTALCFARETQSAQAGGIRERAAILREHGDIEAFPIPAERSRVRGIWDHLRSTLTGRPWVRFLYESREYGARLRKELSRDDIALVHVDSLDLLAYLSAVEHLPRVCVHHNVESALLERRARAESGVRRWYIRHQARLLERAEGKWCPRMDLNVAVSEEDRRAFRDLAPRARFTVFPNGVDVERYAPGPGDGEGLVFVGGTTWFPNRDALAFFHDEILPLLHARGERPPVRWIGSASEEDRAEFGGAEGLTLTGYVEDERPLMREAACFIVPLRVGGGTRLKILNAWAMGLPVVSTTIGCEGLNARDGENILVADTAEEFAEAVTRVTHDPALRDRLARAGREVAVSHYSWDVIGKRMVEAYQAVLEGR